MSGKRKALVGLAGYAGVGKDALAEALTRRGWWRAALADELKADLEKALGPTAFTERKDKEFWRPLLVEYGRLRRLQRAEYWIERLEARMRKEVGQYRPTVVTDLRYRNEAEWVLEQGGMVVYVRRTGCRAANDEERQSIADMLLFAHDKEGAWGMTNDETLAAGQKTLLGLVDGWCG